MERASAEEKWAGKDKVVTVVRRKTGVDIAYVGPLVRYNSVGSRLTE